MDRTTWIADCSVNKDIHRPSLTSSMTPDTSVTVTDNTTAQFERLFLKDHSSTQDCSAPKFGDASYVSAQIKIGPASETSGSRCVDRNIVSADMNIEDMMLINRFESPFAHLNRIDYSTNLQNVNRNRSTNTNIRGDDQAMDLSNNSDACNNKMKEMKIGVNGIATENLMNGTDNSTSREAPNFIPSYNDHRMDPLAYPFTENNTQNYANVHSRFFENLVRNQMHSRLLAQQLLTAPNIFLHQQSLNNDAPGSLTASSDVRDRLNHPGFKPRLDSNVREPVFQDYTLEQRNDELEKEEDVMNHLRGKDLVVSRIPGPKTHDLHSKMEQNSGSSELKDASPFQHKSNTFLKSKHLKLKNDEVDQVERATLSSIASTSDDVSSMSTDAASEHRSALQSPLMPSQHAIPFPLLMPGRVSPSSPTSKSPLLEVISPLPHSLSPSLSLPLPNPLSPTLPVQLLNPLSPTHPLPHQLSPTLPASLQSPVLPSTSTMTSPSAPFPESSSALVRVLAAAAVSQGQGGAGVRKQRGQKKAIPAEKKDRRYFERRVRNNIAAKKSRDARKNREDEVAKRANHLEKENVLLRAQVDKLQHDAETLRNFIKQRARMHEGHPGEGGAM